MVANGVSLGTKINFLLSFSATIALLVARLSEIPAAIFPIVVPLVGQTIYASYLAEPEAGLAAKLLLSCKVTPLIFDRSSGSISHSRRKLIAPVLVTIKSTSHDASESASKRRTAYCAPDAPVKATTAVGMKRRDNRTY